VIQQSQASVTAAAEDAKANRGTGKPSLAAPLLESKNKGKGKNKDNIIGRGKESMYFIVHPFPWLTGPQSRHGRQRRFLQYD
jgi:hypothetical protein